MAKRVTSEDIQKINESYYKTHTYAETARQTGFSAATVKRYVIEGWAPTEKKDVKHFQIDDLPEFDSSVFSGIDNFGDLCVLSASEKDEMEELWKELSI